MSKPRVAFVCVHNSCRSQIAEALGRHLAGEVFESHSAGTEIRPRINQDAVRLMKEIYGIDMEQDQRCKLLPELPPVQIVIKMGCEVACPHVPGQHVEDWGLEDPTGRGDAAFRHTIRLIHEKVLALKAAIQQGDIPLVAADPAEQSRHLETQGTYLCVRMKTKHIKGEFQRVQPSE